MKDNYGKKTSIFILSILFLLPFLSVPIYSNTINLDPSAIEIPPIDDLYFNHSVDINLVFIGFDGFGIDTVYWEQELFDWYRPTYIKENWLFDYPIYYNYNFDLIFANTTTTNDFFTYLDSIAFVQPNPIPTYLDGWQNLLSGNYIYGVNAADIDYWLASQFTYLPGYTLFLINSYDYIAYWYSYAFDYYDPDTGASQYQGYMNCFAGNNTIAFYDYSTPPANYGAGFNCGYANNVTYVPTLFDSWNGTDYDREVINDDLLTIAQFTNDLVFTPSFLYRPRPFKNYVFYYLLVDCTSDYYAYNNPLEFIDTTKVEESFNFLLPTVIWQFEFLKLNVTLDSTLDLLISTYYDDYGTYGVLRATEGGINEYMESYWIGYGNETTKVLPCIFFVFDKTTWYDSGSSTSGTVASANGKDGEGWEVVGTIDKLKTTGGTTALSTHEAGHFVGLRHPHDGWSWKLYEEIASGSICYWLWDYQATTMTYSMSYPFYNWMNKMQLYRGRNIECLNETYYTMIEAYETLFDRGFTEIPTIFTSQLSQVETALDSVESYMNIYYYITASLEAELALEEAQFLLEIAETTVVIPEFNALPLSMIFICFIAISSLVYILRRRKNNGKTI